MNTTVLNLWIVDDEPAMCTGVQRALEEFAAVFADLDEEVRFQITALDSGEALMERLNHHTPPDLLLLDGKLPGIDGIEVMRLIGERGFQMLTVMITAYATLENAIRATKLGAFDFLAKPFTPAELRHAATKAAREIILLSRARRLEQEKRQVRFEFLSVLAHELKSPLAAIEGYVDMLRNGNTDPAVLDRMEVRTSGMRKLIADLLDLTAIESGRRKRDLRDIDAAEITRQVAAGFETALRSRQLELTLDLPDSCPIQADRGEWEMLLGNLLSNAIKYNVPNGRVTIQLAREADHVRLAVHDTGIGISAPDQAKLFAEFTRIRNSRTRGIEGSGLGLSIVSRLAALYGGTVSVSSQEGQGSTFTVTWPGSQPAASTGQNKETGT